MLQHLFAAHLVDDDRTPTLEWDVGHYHVGLLAPEPVFNLQVIVLLLIQMAIGNMLAVLCYYGIILRHSDQSPVTPFLVTFGIVLPLTWCIPFIAMDSLDIRSTVLRMGLVALPICVPLTCLQAYFGYTPDVAKRSLRNFCCHMGFLMKPIYDENGPKRTTWNSFRQAVATHGYYYMINAVLYSLLAPVHYKPFRTVPEAHEIFLSVELKHLFNNFVAAVLLSLSLAFSLSGVNALVQLVGGFQCESAVDSPMFASTSPSDFWGRRWNRLVHSGLKNGIYKPVRSWTNSRSIATVATFLASGLIHEYVWLVLFYQNVHQDVIHTPPFGKSMLFFGWNGLLLVLEYTVGEKWWNSLISNVPRPFVTLLVVLLALPVGHLFTGDMIVGGYFQTLQLALPLLVVTSKGSQQAYS